jgi:hypothetical protein
MVPHERTEGIINVNPAVLLVLYKDRVRERFQDGLKDDCGVVVGLHRLAENIHDLMMIALALKSTPSIDVNCALTQFHSCNFCLHAKRKKDTFVVETQSGHWSEQLSQSNGLLVVLAIICVLAWDWLVPIKILIVFFHESAHALATVLTGGEVLSMHIVANQGGQVESLGGIPWIIVTAGYLGSLLIGAFVLLCASHSKADRVLMGIMAAVMILITLLYVRNGYGLVFGLVSAAAMIGCAAFLPNWCNDALLKLIGLMSILYVPWDIFNDTLQRSELRSDARILAELIGGSTMMWGALWLAISLVVAVASLYFARIRVTSAESAKPAP